MEICFARREMNINSDRPFMPSMEIFVTRDSRVKDLFDHSYSFAVHFRLGRSSHLFSDRALLSGPTRNAVFRRFY